MACSPTPKGNSKSCMFYHIWASDTPLLYQRVAILKDRCPPGYFCNASEDGRPTACPAGTYQPNVAVDSVSGCMPCPTGHACPLATSVPEACAPGTYRDTPGAGPDDCLPCPAGHQCQAATSVPEVCPQGTFAPLSATVACLTCALGTYTSAGGGATACDTCPQGSFCSFANQLPLPCPGGTYGATQGLTNVSECTPCSAG